MTPKRIPSPDHPDAPKYWMYETSGSLATAVDQFLRAPSAMTQGDIALMRAYLVQWIDSPVWDMNPAADQYSRLIGLRERAKRIRTCREVCDWIHEAVGEGMDPL